MAASLSLFRMQRHLGTKLDRRLSCLRLSWIQNALGSGMPIANRRWKSSKKTVVVPEDKVMAPYRVYRVALDKVVAFLTTYVDKLETRMPKTYQVYKTFRTGVSMFMLDTKQYYRITTRLWNGESMSHFTRRELELYRQFSSDLPVVAVVLILAFAPGGVFIFPVAYMFPRYLLSSHFWTKDQKEEFTRQEMTQRLGYYTPFLDLMYNAAQGTQYQQQVQRTVSKLTTTVPLTYQEIMLLKPMFENKPYSLDSLYFKYKRVMGKSLGLSPRTHRLETEARLIRYIDVALRREGLHNLTNEDLSRACAWRGLNPQGVDRETKLAYLNKWTHITANVNRSSLSLLLHLPLLLGYCQSSNRRIIRSRRTGDTFRR